MMESSNEYQSNKISFDAIKIGLASPVKDPLSGPKRRSKET